MTDRMLRMLCMQKMAWWIGALLLIQMGTANLLLAQTGEEENPLRRRTTEAANLAETQERLAGRYDRLEMLAGRLAELSRATQPRRAKLLQELIAKSRDRGVEDQFEQVLNALQRESLGPASQLQGELHIELKQLLELLLREDRERQIESKRKRIRKYLAELNRLIRIQRGVRARTEGGDDSKRLAKDQQRVAEGTEKLHQQIKANEGDSKPGKPSQQKPGNMGKPSDGKPNNSKPSDGKPNPSKGNSSEAEQDSSNQQESPADRAMRRLQQARKRMQRAQQQLQDLKHQGATQEQEKALEALQQAKAELQRILRQLREEELERMLALLEARFRKMLAAQVEVYDATKKLDTAQANLPTHELEIAAGRLSRKERQIIQMAERALTLLQEDGTSLAFPEALNQAKEDMQTVATRLAALQVATLTQSIEEDIIAALEESLAAIQQAIKKLRQQKGKQKKSSGQPDKKPLVDQLAELRMIRSLQHRVNRRTTMYAKLIEGEQTMQAELQEALNRLASRQHRIFEATRDLHSGANR